MTDTLRTMLNELNADGIKEVKAFLTDLAKTKKEALKADKVSADEARVAEVDAMISEGTLKTGMQVVILYGSKNVELTGEIVGVLSTEKASLTIESDDFDGKVNENGKKRRYIAKSRFVRVA